MFYFNQRFKVVVRRSETSECFKSKNQALSPLFCTNLYIVAVHILRKQELTSANHERRPSSVTRARLLLKFWETLSDMIGCLFRNRLYQLGPGWLFLKGVTIEFWVTYKAMYSNRRRLVRGTPHWPYCRIMSAISASTASERKGLGPFFIILFPRICAVTCLLRVVRGRPYFLAEIARIVPKRNTIWWQSSRCWWWFSTMFANRSALWSQYHFARMRSIFLEPFMVKIWTTCSHCEYAYERANRCWI